MSSIESQKVGGLLRSGGIVERPYARTFAVRTSTGAHYLATIAANPVGVDHAGSGDVCTCKAGQNGRRCYHVSAAHVLARQTPPPVGELVRLLRALVDYDYDEDGARPWQEAIAQARALLAALDGRGA